MSWDRLSPELRALIEEVCTEKQINVLKLKAAGVSTRGIARVLDVDPVTVRGHLERAYKRIRARADDLSALHPR